MFLNILLEISVLMTTCQMCAATRQWLPKNIPGSRLSCDLLIEAILREKETPFWMISRPQSHTIRAPTVLRSLSVATKNSSASPYCSGHESSRSMPSLMDCRITPSIPENILESNISHVPCHFESFFTACISSITFVTEREIFLSTA